jgi:hypothetical protein
MIPTFSMRRMIGFCLIIESFVAIGCSRNAMVAGPWIEVWPPKDQQGTASDASGLDNGSGAFTSSDEDPSKQPAGGGNGQSTQHAQRGTTSRRGAATNPATQHASQSGEATQTDDAALVQDQRLNASQQRLLADQLHTLRQNLVSTRNSEEPQPDPKARGFEVVDGQSHSSIPEPSGRLRAPPPIRTPSANDAARQSPSSAQTSASETTDTSPASSLTPSQSDRLADSRPTVPTRTVSAHEPDGRVVAASPNATSQTVLYTPTDRDMNLEQIRAEAHEGTPQDGSTVSSSSARPAVAASTVQNSRSGSASDARAVPDSSIPSDQTQGQTPQWVPGQWRRELEEAIASLRRELQQLDESSTQERMRLEAALRLMFVLAERRDESVRGIDGLDPGAREFWKLAAAGFYELLDPQGAPVPDRRHKLALRYLREAVQHLASASSLDVRNLAICRRVDSFGQYTEFDPYVFKPEQEVILYVEVVNFAVEQKENGFETEFQGSYQILDAQGRRIADYDLPLDKQTCRNIRTDYFLPYRIFLPKSLKDGSYQIQVTIEDKKGKKFGQTPPVSFTIRS